MARRITKTGKTTKTSKTTKTGKTPKTRRITKARKTVTRARTASVKGKPRKAAKPSPVSSLRAAVVPQANILARDITLPGALTDRECERARRMLIRLDPRLAPVIQRVGRCRLPDSRTHHPFLSLARAVVSQQLSGKAAETIFGRVVALVGGPEGLTPANLLSADQGGLRTAGLSRQKISYLRDLAEHVSDGRLDLETLRTKSDEDVIEAITAVKGFGRWSAEMFLMFQLNRPDVFPLADLGIVKGVQRVLGMKTRPKAVTMLRASGLWRPYRSVAAWYLWRILEESAPAVRPLKPKAPAAQQSTTR